MSDRPAIPIEVQRDVLFAARHRCAVCCEALPLELAHIIPWHETRDHRSENLIALCGNCHARADKEKWGMPVLRRYRLEPCALRANSLPVSAEQQALVDIIIASQPDAMTDRQRLRLVSIVAAYAGVSVGEARLVSIMPANSSRIRLELPKDAAARLVEGFRNSDPRLAAFLEEFKLLAVEADIEPLPAEHLFSSRPLRIFGRLVGDVTVLELEGRITLGDGSTALAEAFRKLREHGRTKILVNLGAVTYMDGSGIGALVSGSTSVTNSGGQVKLLNLNKRVKDMLQITKLYTVFDNEQRAIESFKPA